jgi:hypothetical protein
MNPTLPNELPFWELESRWILKSLESNYRGKKPLDLNFFYIVGNFLECRCVTWALMTHLGSWNISYGQKKGWESNWQFDCRPLKVRNLPNFLACKWHATYRWKDLDEGYNFALDLISIRGLHTKLWASKVVGIPILGISGLPSGSPRRKWHLGAGPVARHRLYYKEEGGGFPQVQAMVSLVSSSLPVVRPCTKNVQTMH